MNSERNRGTLALSVAPYLAWCIYFVIQAERVPNRAYAPFQSLGALFTLAYPVSFTYGVLAHRVLCSLRLVSLPWYLLAGLVPSFMLMVGASVWVQGGAQGFVRTWWAEMVLGPLLAGAGWFILHVPSSTPLQQRGGAGVEATRE